MIDSNIIEWIDFGDSTQKMDVYAKSYLKKIKRLLRTLAKHKNFMILEIIFMILFFIQLLSMSAIFIIYDKDLILEILNFFKNIILFFEIVNDYNIYIKFVFAIVGIILLDIIFMIIILFTIKYMKLTIIISLINILNIAIFYYLLGPIIEICLLTFWCENGQHKILNIKCFSNIFHILNIIISTIIFILYFLISFIFSIYCNEIGAVSVNLKENFIRIYCNYETFCNIIKIVIFIFYFIIRNKNNIILKLIYVGFIIIICLIMIIYIYKNVYFYNNTINYINYLGWSFSFWFSICIFFKILLNINNISIFVITGWIIIIILIYRLNELKEFLLITESNILEFKSIKSIEMYKNILLKLLSEKKKTNSRILLHGIIKSFEEFINNNPEIYYQYQKLTNDNNLIHKFDKETDLPILSIIYILYSNKLDKSSNKLEIAIYMSYFLINNFNNATYATSLCSKIKAPNHIGLYYKYLLTEDIKEYLGYKLKDSKKESLKHIQIGSIILYYLYIDIFKMKIYDAVNNRIEYFDILKNNITTNKTALNFLKLGNTIRKARKTIKKVWNQIIELNPFSDEARKYYMIYIDIILQDEYLSKNENKKFTLLKNNKIQEKFNIYHSMFLVDTSAIMLVDGYLSNGKILYASQNFPFLFNYNVKELLNITIEDLLPNAIQSFHKELIENALKYSNITYIFKRQISTLLKNKNGGLVSINIFIKPSPNLTYGLIYFTYLQKIKKNYNFVIVLDKDLRINGFTETIKTGNLLISEEDYGLNPSLLGYHIGVIIPDILPLLEFKNEEFNLIKRDIELKGYLFQVHRLNEVKSKVDIILEKIKNTKIININNEQFKIEENFQIINNEFNDLISELNKEKIKPFSIFYKINLYSFLDGKYKYYRIYIDNDIITGKETDNKLKNIYEKTDIKKFESSISKISKESQNKLKNKKIIVNNNYNNKDSNLNDNNNELDKLENINFSYKNNENEEKIEENGKNNKKFIQISSNSQSKFIDNRIDQLKLNIVNGNDSNSIKIMKYLSLVYFISTILIMIYNETFVKRSFRNLSTFLNQNLLFNITKMNIAVMYIAATNIKWQLHGCEQYSSFNMTYLYDKLIRETIEYLLYGKNEVNYFFDEYNDILNTKRNEIELNIYGTDRKEKYLFNFDNLITFYINNGINLINKYNSYLRILLENENKAIDQKIYGLYELDDFIEETYNYFYSDLNGFKGEEKNKQIKKVFYNFPYGLIYNGLILLVILSFYLILTLRMYNTEKYFLEKLINFNTPNFDSFLKKLEELKKKFRNENNNEEEDEDKEDIEDSVSKKSLKKDEEEDKNKITKNELNHIKKNKKKDANKQKQKKNKFKIMYSFFFKVNLFFVIKLLVIILLTLSYYIISFFCEINKKNEFLEFDTINDNIIGIFKESFDIFIIYKRQLQLYEEKLKDCKIYNENDLYRMNIPSISEIKTPNLGNNIIQIIGDKGFKEETLKNFTEFFRGNACPLLSHNALGLYICTSFWEGILTRGMEQTITKIGNRIESIIEELNSINERGKTLNEIVKLSKFLTFEIFVGFYYQRAYIVVDDMFKFFRSEKLESIIKLIKIIFIIFIVLCHILTLFLIYFILDTKFIFDSFLNFIWILPTKYLSEDENFYKEIIEYANYIY